MATFTANTQMGGNTMMLTGARAHFCAGHTLPQHPMPHGHSYEVWAFIDGDICAEKWQGILRGVCAELDHKMLNDVIEPPTMENIAKFIAQLIGAIEVRVIRPVEGLSAEYRK